MHPVDVYDEMVNTQDALDNMGRDAYPAFVFDRKDLGNIPAEYDTCYFAWINIEVQDAAGEMVTLYDELETEEGRAKFRAFNPQEFSWILGFYEYEEDLRAALSDGSNDFSDSNLIEGLDWDSPTILSIYEKLKTLREQK